DPTTRVPTGVSGLDELVNGGYFLGSTTLVVGVSGVGKSVMALQFIAEGARHGEHSLMLSLDETPAQIMRNGRTIGIDLEPDIARGVVRVQYDSPQEIEIDRHFAQIERVAEEFKPKRVVIDSLSTYGSTLGSSKRIFRDFFHALVALMKEHQIAAVYNHENPEILGMSSMAGEYQMSSLVDNILLLNWIELGDEFRLALTVAKMRGNPTMRVTRECDIVYGEGCRVLPRQVPASAPGLFAECAQRCLRQEECRSTVLVARRSGLAVVGTPLVLNDQIVGAAVGGYHLVDFPQAVAIERAANDAGVPVAKLWDVVRRETPVSRARFIVEGELLQVLGDTILRENDRTRQYEEIASELSAAVTAKDEFLAVLSHELRTPLTPILGWARMLRSGTLAPEATERALDTVERNTRLQAQLVEDLLDVSRIIAGKLSLDLRPVALGPLVD